MLAGNYYSGSEWQPDCNYTNINFNQKIKSNGILIFKKIQNVDKTGSREPVSLRLKNKY